jgi:DNA polymerase-3 subunit epsilon
MTDGRWQLAERAIPIHRAREAGGELLGGLTWVVVDVETTGTGVWRGDRLTEWAAVVVRNGKVAEVVESLVNPQRVIPYHVSRLTNITGEMVARAPLFADVCSSVVEVLSGGVFVAHNATFDWHFLSQEVLRAGGGRLTGRRLCTVRLARAVLPQLPRRSLDALSAYFGVENHARHRAGGDALATAKVLTRLLGLAGERDCHTWSDLQSLMRRAPKRKRRQRLPRSIDVDPTL